MFCITIECDHCEMWECESCLAWSEVMITDTPF